MRKIFSIIASILNWAIILIVILYPILVRHENPFGFYWDRLQELWDVVRLRFF